MVCIYAYISIPWARIYTSAHTLIGRCMHAYIRSHMYINRFWFYLNIQISVYILYFFCVFLVFLLVLLVSCWPSSSLFVFFLFFLLFFFLSFATNMKETVFYISKFAVWFCYLFLSCIWIRQISEYIYNMYLYVYMYVCI